MAAGPEDTGQKKAQEISQDAPGRPDAVRRAVAGTERADFVAQQTLANQMFRQNSERLQKGAEAKLQSQQREQPASGERTLKFAKDRERGNYNELKQQHSGGAEVGSAGAKTQDAGERKLKFAKDGPDRSQASQKQDQAKGTGKELSFAKDRNIDPSRGR